MKKSELREIIKKEIRLMESDNNYYKFNNSTQKNPFFIYGYFDKTGKFMDFSGRKWAVDLEFKSSLHSIDKIQFSKAQKELKKALKDNLKKGDYLREYEYPHNFKISDGTEKVGTGYDKYLNVSSIPTITKFKK